jgi:hypothetical protein
LETNLDYLYKKIVAIAKESHLLSNDFTQVHQLLKSKNIMTDSEKTILWESLHECYAIAQVIAHSSNYLDGQVDRSVFVSSYATLLERSTKLLGKSIAIVDNLKTNQPIDNQLTSAGSN